MVSKSYDILKELDTGEDSEDSDIDEQNQNLGTATNCWQKFVMFMTQPKLNTNYYNLNGKDVYQSKWTIIVFACMLSTLGFIFVWEISPVFYSLFKQDFYSSVTL